MGKLNWLYHPIWLWTEASHSWNHQECQAYAIGVDSIWPIFGWSVWFPLGHTHIHTLTHKLWHIQSASYSARVPINSVRLLGCQQYNTPVCQCKLHYNPKTHNVIPLNNMSLVSEHARLVRVQLQMFHSDTKDFLNFQFKFAHLY